MNGNKKTILTMLAAIVIAATLIAPLCGPARAQGTYDDALTVRTALERTDEVISRAGEVVNDTRSEKGRVSLQFALELQERAWANYNAAIPNLRLAQRLTERARSEAWHAMSLARSDMRSEDGLTRVAEEARERLAAVRDQMNELNVRDEHALKLMNEAHGLLDKSRVNAQQNRYQLAFRLATNARQLALQTEEHVRNTRRLKDSVERRIMLLERLVWRSRERVNESDNEKPRAELRVAERKLALARELLAEGRYGEARQACEACEQMLRGIVRARRLNLPAEQDPARRAT